MKPVGTKAGWMSMTQTNSTEKLKYFLKIPMIVSRNDIMDATQKVTIFYCFKKWNDKEKLKSVTFSNDFKK